MIQGCKYINVFSTISYFVFIRVTFVRFRGFHPLPQASWTSTFMNSTFQNVIFHFVVLWCRLLTLFVNVSLH